MNPYDFENMTVVQLETALADLRAERDHIKELLRQAIVVYDQKMAVADARRKVEAMSDAERTALAQIILPISIESSETFGG